MYLADSYKKCSQPKLPRLASAALTLARLRRFNFCLRIFSTNLRVHIFPAIFHWVLRLHIGSCLGLRQVGRRWLYEKCAKSQRHLWTGCTSSCHPELDSGSINAKKFQNFFILFAKKCNFFTIIKLYNLFF